MTEQLDADEQKVLDNIRDHGCTVMYVFDDAGQLPDFSYSVGFPVSIEQPEVIVFGLKREVMHFMVNEVRRQCADGLPLSDGQQIAGLIDGFDCVARHVTDEAALREHFGWAIWFHETQLQKPMTEAYQLVWPGAVQGLFPWDEGCVADVIDSQPALYAMGEAA